MHGTPFTSTLLFVLSLMFSGLVSGQSLPPMGEVENQAMSDTLQYALEYNKTNQAADWSNSNTSHTGSVVPVGTFIGDQGQPCRDFSTTITIDGNLQQGYGTACRQPNGTWYLVNKARPARVTGVPSQPMPVYQPPVAYYTPPYSYYNPYPVNFSFSFGYLFDGGSLYIGSSYPFSPRWHPRRHWRPITHRYYPPPRQFPYYRPYSRPSHRPHFRSAPRPHFRPDHRRPHRR